MRDLQLTEAQMGRMSSLLSDIADALTYNPACIVTVGQSGEDSLALSREDWPDYDAIVGLLAQWETQRRRATEIWAHLEESERATLSPPCPTEIRSLAPLV